MIENHQLVARCPLSRDALATATDNDLAHELLFGNCEALAALIDRYQRLIYTIAVRIVHDKGEAEDLVQIVFLEIFRKVKLFDQSKGTFRVWLLRYAYTRSMNRRDHLERRRFYSTVELDEMGPMAVPRTGLFDGALTEHEATRFVGQALDVLNPKQRYRGIMALRDLDAAKFALPRQKAYIRLQLEMERGKLFSSKHDRLRELCVLAAAGDLPASETDRVRVHLDKCGSCRALFAELRDVHAIQLAHVPSFATHRELEEESRLKDSILRASRAVNLQLPEPAQSQDQYEKPEISVIGSIREVRGWSIGVSVCLLAGCLALAFALRRIPALTGHNAAIAPHSVATSIPPNSLGHDEETPNREIGELRQRVASLEAKRSRFERLLQESQSENAKIQSDNTQRQEQQSALSRELDSARAAEAKASQRLERLTAENESDKAAIAAQNVEIRSLNEKLEDKTASQEQARDVIEAEHRLREIVAARNLHLVDVADTDSQGRTKKAVGRVFYTEGGKSLVFYAYDLSTRHTDSGKYAYYVWGNKDGNLETVRNLGTLDADDLQQKRWKLQVEDSKVLADIDRVFVTIEPVGKLGPRPHGKRILEAYLGSPANHP